MHSRRCYNNGAGGVAVTHVNRYGYLYFYVYSMGLGRERFFFSGWGTKLLLLMRCERHRQLQ
jgi:hypothetical protein